MRIVQTENQEPGYFWQFLISEKDAKIYCKVCRQSVSAGDHVYLCELCSKVTHVDCCYQNHVFKANRLCNHYNKPEFQIYNGRVKVEK